MKTSLLVALLTISSAMTFAANTPAKKTEAPAPAGPVKRLYTEEEFQKAAIAEAEKMMKKAGSGHLVDFSKELLQKEEALKVRELNIQKQEEQLKINSTEFKKKLVEFEDSQKKFLGCIDSQNEKQQKRINQMVEVISGMKPQNAADVLAVQDPDLSVRILGQLEAQKASKIFNLMDKEVSAKLQRQFLQMKK
jgi:flagellar motility protein MotE (MotC chaperone)